MIAVARRRNFDTRFSDLLSHGTVDWWGHVPTRGDGYRKSGVMAETGDSLSLVDRYVGMGVRRPQPTVHTPPRQVHNGEQEAQAGGDTDPAWAG